MVHFTVKNKKESHTHLRKLNCDGEIVCYRGRGILEPKISPGSIMTTDFCFAQFLHVAV